jgi:hypothetical protein
MRRFEQKETKGTKGTKETAKKTLAFSLPSPSFFVFFVTFPTFPAGIPDLFNIPNDLARSGTARLFERGLGKYFSVRKLFEFVIDSK